MLNQIESLPDLPGVYQYFDKDLRLLYIGKAKSLKKRVKSYFRFTPLFKINPSVSPRVYKMLEQTVTLRYIVVDSEHDALILENSLIKQLRPRYNILLRDDKTYPYIYIDHSEEFARFEITRKVITGREIEYFGPYSVGARDILDSLYELIPLVQKAPCLKGKKACLYYQMKRCKAPCEGKISPDEYRGFIEQAKRLIVRKKELVLALKNRMLSYAEELRFEEAQILRDRCERIDKSEPISNIDLASNANFDIFAIAISNTKASLVKMFMRDGRVVSSTQESIRIDEDIDIDELYERALLEFYTKNRPPIVASILVADQFSEMRWVESSIGKLLKSTLKISSPIRGAKRRLVELALLNAKESLKDNSSMQHQELLMEFQKLCKLTHLPQRIEIFDNSHLAQSSPVAGMVVYDRGQFDKSSYRHYNLNSKDEYAQMRETLSRRIKSFDKNPPPDLWIIDGGSTLLSLAISLIDSSGVNLDVVAISKEKRDGSAYRAKGVAADTLHTRDGSIKLRNNDRRVMLAQKLRDEAHRFAITFHQKSRTKASMQSKLLQTKGISEAKVKKLLNFFGSYEEIRRADEKSLKLVVSQKDAENIKKL